MQRFSSRYIAYPLAFAMVGGCDQPTQKSLVGSWTLPTYETLKNETVVLWVRDLRGDDAWRTQSFTVKPGGVVLMEKGREFPGRIGESRHLTEEKAARILDEKDYRFILSVAAELRPEKLTAEGPRGKVSRRAGLR